MGIIERGGKWLDRLRLDIDATYPDFSHDVPPSDELHIGKLQGGFASLDTCNAAKLLGRNLIKKVDAIAEEKLVIPLKINDQVMKTKLEPCQQHLRNVCLNAVNNEMTKHMRGILRENNESFDNRLRIHLDIPSCVRALHKQFSLAATYAKGKGETFRTWMSKNHPNELLWHVKSVNGSRQDICVDASACIFWNRKYYVKFLATHLCYGNKDNCLEDSLFVILTSTEFIAVTRVMCMLMVAVSQPWRYLAGCSHTFGSYGWSNRHM